MDQIREYLLHFSGPARYAVFYFILMSCCVGMPFNSDLCLITAASLAALGVFDIRFLIPLAFIALLAGDSITFFVGRRFGREFLNDPMIQKVIPPQRIQMAEHYLQTRGTKYLFVVRFLPLIRTALYLTSGCLRVNVRSFYLMDGLSTAIYLPLVMGTSYYASAHIDELIEVLKKFQFGLLAIVIIGAAIFFYRRRTPKPDTK